MVSVGHPLSGRESVQLSEIDNENYGDMPHDMLGERWSRWWAVDPRPDGSPIRYTPSARSIPELLKIVTSGRADTIAPGLPADVLARRALAFVRVSDIEPSEVMLCTRRGTSHQGPPSCENSSVASMVRAAVTVPPEGSPGDRPGLVRAPGASPGLPSCGGEVCCRHRAGSRTFWLMS